MGKPGVRVWQKGQQEVWTRQLSNGDYAGVLFNRDNTTAATMTLDWV